MLKSPSTTYQPGIGYNITGWIVDYTTGQRDIAVRQLHRCPECRPSCCHRTGGTAPLPSAQCFRGLRPQACRLPFHSLAPEALLYLGTEPLDTSDTALVANFAICAKPPPFELLMSPKSAALENSELSSIPASSPEPSPSLLPSPPKLPIAPTVLPCAAKPCQKKVQKSPQLRGLQGIFC